MSAGTYSVIQCVPDPMRGEVFNIGLLIWDGENLRISVHQDAAQRAINRSPYLAPDSWAYIEEMLRHRLAMLGGATDQTIAELSREGLTDTLALSQPAYVKLTDEADSLDRRLDELVDRLVKPPTRGGSNKSPEDELKRLLRSQISANRISVNHIFQRTRSGEARRVPFYLNSNANIAVTTVRLDLKRQSTVHDNVDSLAFRIEDVREANDVDYLVYGRTQPSENQKDALDYSKRIFDSVGATMLTNPNEVAARLVESDPGTLDLQFGTA